MECPVSFVLIACLPVVSKAVAFQMYAWLALENVAVRLNRNEHYVFAWHSKGVVQVKM